MSPVREAEAGDEAPAAGFVLHLQQYAVRAGLELEWHNVVIEVADAVLPAVIKRAPR
jgi:hypothetical protein